jgi:bifunctional DNA-binding transcriptional regulator/antitoxin component of YhaV-PrlF toxin-antitoxin module
LYASSYLYDETREPYYEQMASIEAKVTRNGQVSLPAELRHRWGVASVLVIDRGEYAIVRPIPQDIVAALRGAHAGPGPSVEATRAAERADDHGRRPVTGKRR